MTTILRHLLAFIFGDPRPVPAGPEVGVDDDGAVCTGYPTGETARVFVTPNRKVVFPPIDRLEELASGSLGPVDPRLIGQGAGGPVVDR